MEQNDILVTTTETLPGREVVEALGVVKGSTIQSRHIGGDIMASLKSIIGGEIKGYGKTFVNAREEAEGRMIEQARVLGAHAIICSRYATSQIMDGGVEVLSYGTAVRLR